MDPMDEFLNDGSLAEEAQEQEAVPEEIAEMEQAEQDALDEAELDEQALNEELSELDERERAAAEEEREAKKRRLEICEERINRTPRTDRECSDAALIGLRMAQRRQNEGSVSFAHGDGVAEYMDE